MLKNKFGFARANSLKTAPVSQLLAAGVLSLALGVALDHSDYSAAAGRAIPALEQAAQDINQSAPLQAVADVRSAVAAAIKPVVAPRPQLSTREAEIDDGQNFADMLEDAGILHADAVAAMNALGRVYDLRRLKAGQDVTLSFLRAGNQETLTGISLQPEATRDITITHTADGRFMAASNLVPVTQRHIAAIAPIHSSLYAAGEAAHVPHAVMASLMHIYAHEIDFQRDIHPGDRFEILYDQPTNARGQAVGQGSIVYAAMFVGGKAKPIYRVDLGDGTVDYFDDHGQSTRRTLLRTPVAAAHITSGFGMRINPILGYSKMHQGVDFGAPQGTPIFAAGAGTVVDMGPKGGYGRYIKIRHNGSLETVYAHMSRFAQNMYRGAHVEQGTVIGYVGSTGRSTGPHLHFEIHVAGKPVNPLTFANTPAGRMLSGKLLAQFQQTKSIIRDEFAALARKGSVLPASATAPAFGFRLKSASACGLRGGC